jgi:hypothetical protein
MAKQQQLCVAAAAPAFCNGFLVVIASRQVRRRGAAESDPEKEERCCRTMRCVAAGREAAGCSLG